MKKATIITLIITTIFLCCACSKENLNILKKEKTLNCTNNETDDDGLKTTNDVKVVYNNTKVLSMEETTITEVDPEYLESSYTFSTGIAEKLNNIEGIEMKYSKIDNNKIKLNMSIHYDKLDYEEVKKTFKDLFDEDISDSSFYSSNNLTIDEFKEQHLSEYNCN